MIGRSPERNHDRNPNHDSKPWKKIKELPARVFSLSLGCTFHVMHNCFHKGVETLPYNIEDFALDLYAWFKHFPCKEEDFKSLENSIELQESMVLKHATKRWLTLSTEFSKDWMRFLFTKMLGF